MKNSSRILQLAWLLLSQVSFGFCGLSCKLEGRNYETLSCVPLGLVRNNIKPQGINTKVTDQLEDLTPVEMFQKYDWSTIKTFVLKNVNLNSLHPDLFMRASSLEYLDLSGNADLRIRGAFIHLHNLRSLKLSESSLSSKSDINEVLKLSQLQTLNISNMKRSKIMEAHVFLKELKRLQNLEYLDVSSNNIDDLRKYDFNRKLKSINLSHNRLTIGDRNFENATNLTYLFLSNSSIRNIPDNAFKGTQIIHLDLSFNSISLDSLSSLTPSMTHVNLSHNGLLHVLFNLTTLSNSVEVLDVSNNELREIEQLGTRDTRNVRTLNVARNRLYNINGFVGFIELVDLDLSFNLLLTLPPLAFSGAAKLESLKLSGNRIYQISESSFSANSALRFLSLRGNAIASLGVKRFKGLNRLYEIDLSDNNLKTVPYDLLYEGSLQILDLSCNWLSYLPNNFFSEFPKFGILVLYGNPWKCGCLSKILEKFLQDPKYFVDGSYPSCYAGEIIDESCRDTALNDNEIDNWISAREASAIPC